MDSGEDAAESQILFTENNLSIYFKRINDGHDDRIHWRIFCHRCLPRRRTRGRQHQIANARVHSIYRHVWLAGGRARFIRLTQDEQFAPL